MWSDKSYTCALGRSGITQDKREGDGATPAGCFSIREVLYRADKLSEPVTSLPTSVIQENDGWCVEIDDANYNKKITFPYSAHYEKLWREDNVYDIIVPLGYNDDPATPGKGSAIFMHVARENYSPTEGCVALSLPDLLRILKEIPREVMVCISQ